MVDQIYLDNFLADMFDKITKEVYGKFSIKNSDKDIVPLLQEKKKEWLNTPLSIAIIGRSGTGKSSFINALFNLRGGDEEAAPTGIDETTMTRKCYRHPNNQNMLLWDLPGVGTTTFKRESYLDNIQFEEYDCFVLISFNRFTDDDAFLGAEIQKRKKNCYYVRTKIGLDVNSNRRSYPKTHNEENLLKKIHADTAKELGKRHPTAQVFLVDSHMLNEFEFSKLAERMVTDFPENKRHALILTLDTLSQSIISLKAQTLRGQITYVAVLSASLAALPITGLSIACDLSIILEEALRYRKQLSVSENMLKDFSQDIRDKLYADFMDRIIKSFNGANPFVKEGIIMILKSLGPRIAALMIAEEFLKFVPLIGSVAASGLSFYTMQQMLHKILDVVEDSSIKYFQEATVMTLKNRSNRKP